MPSFYQRFESMCVYYTHFVWMGKFWGNGNGQSRDLFNQIKMTDFTNDSWGINTKPCHVLPRDGTLLHPLSIHQQCSKFSNFYCFLTFSKKGHQSLIRWKNTIALKYKCIWDTAFVMDIYLFRGVSVTEKSFEQKSTQQKIWIKCGGEKGKISLALHCNASYRLFLWHVFFKSRGFLEVRAKKLI